MTIKFSNTEKAELVQQLRLYFDRELNQELGQFDAEFLLDFISEKFGVMYYNRGLQDAQTVLQDRLDSLLEAITEQEQPVTFHEHS